MLGWVVEQCAKRVRCLKLSFYVYARFSWGKWCCSKEGVASIFRFTVMDSLFYRSYDSA